MVDKPVDLSREAEELNSEEQIHRRDQVLDGDQKRKAAVDDFTDAMVKAVEGTKEFDKAYQESGYKEQFDNLEYCEREEDPELKAMYEEQQERFSHLSERMHGKVDGELDMDLQGNITFRPPGVKRGSSEAKAGMDEAGTYVLRDGKLVKGTGETRE